MLKPYFDVVTKNKNSSKSQSSSLNIDFDKHLETGKQLLIKYWYVPLILIAVLLLRKCEMPRIMDKTPPPPVEDCQFAAEEKETIINDNLQFSFVIPGMNYDGDLEIRIVNLSEELKFRLDQIGMQHTRSSGEDRQYHNPRVNLLINPLEERTIEVNFPSFRKSRGNPYAILDATTIICDE